MEALCFSGSSNVIRDARALWLCEFDPAPSLPALMLVSLSESLDGLEESEGGASGSFWRRGKSKADLRLWTVSVASVVGAVVMMDGADCRVNKMSLAVSMKFQGEAHLLASVAGLTWPDFGPCVLIEDRMRV